MGRLEAVPERTCRCGALMQQSWWHELLENADYQVVRVDSVNPVVDVLTFSIASEPDARHPVFLTVADVDWPTLLANFADPVLTRNGEDAAGAVHDMLIAKLRKLLGADHAATPESALSSVDRLPGG